MSSFLIIASQAASFVGFRRPLIQALLDAGLTVHAAAPDLTTNERVRASLEGMGVILHDIPMARTGMNPLKDAYTLLALRTLIHRLQPTYTLGYTIKPVIYGGLAARLARVPHRFALITGLGYAFMDEDRSTKRRFINYIARKLYQLSLRSAERVFFQNPDDQQLFNDTGILNSHTPTTVVNGSGVDIDEYPHTPLPPPTPIRFLLIAQLIADKGIREYAQAAAIIKQRYPEVQFDLVGRLDTNPNAIRQEELDEWVASGLINHLGYLTDVRSSIADCHVYVLPSYREGTPRSTLEALSMGRAVITTDAPGCRETVIEGVNGFLVPSKDATALANAMERFINSPELIARMGLRSRQLATEKYDVRIVNEQMLKGMGII